MFYFVVLNQQCLEFLAMLDVKQQKAFQENISMNKSDITDFTGLEVSIAYVFFKVGASRDTFVFKIHRKN